MSSGSPVAVLVVDRYHEPPQVYELATERDTILGGAADDIDVGESAPVARIVPGAWILHVIEEGRESVSVQLRHGQLLPLIGFRARFLLAPDIAQALDEDRYVIAIVDPLTEVFTRRFVAGHIHRIQLPAALLAIDLDRFKHLNDQYGFTFGDCVLHETAARIQAAVRWPELVARIGGEEFLVILPRIAQGRAIERAEAIRRAIEPPFEIEGEALTSTVSIGVAMLATPGEQAFLDAWRTAEGHLELAETRGRNRVVASG